MISPFLSSAVLLAGLAGHWPPTLGLTLAPSVVVGGNPVTATLSLSAPAPTGGTVVTVTTSSIAVAGLVSPRLGPMSSVTRLDVPIAEGARSATVTIQTSGVAVPTTATIQAFAGTDAASASLTLNPTSVRALSIAPARVTGGQSLTGTIMLDGKTPAITGANVALTLTATVAATDGSVRTVSITDGSSNTVSSGVSLPATVPASASIRGGASAGTFTISTVPVTSSTQITVVASLGTAQSATFTIAPPATSVIQVNPQAVFGGSAATGTVILTGTAPTRGLTIPLSSSSTDASVPASVTVPAGSDRQSFPVTTVSVTSSHSVTIAARQTIAASSGAVTDGTSNTVLLGESTAGPSASLAIVAPPRLQSITAQPSNVIAGAPATISVAFTTAGGSNSGLVASAQLAADHPETIQLPASVPLTSTVVTLTAGPTVVTANGVTLAPPATETVTISASLGSQRVSTTLTVILPIASFTVGGPSVRGGTSFVGSITLSPSIAAAQTVTFTTNHPELVQAPGSTTLVPGNSGVRLPFRTSAVTIDTPVTITAASGAQRVSATVTLVP